MKLGYNTNGLPHHRWPDALQLIADTGYRSAAITVDHYCLDPFAEDWQSEAARMREWLDRLQLSCVVETGARFLLNPRIKHEPTLLSPEAEDRAVRIDFLKRCIDIAVILRADAVSFWSGILRDDSPRETALQRLVAGLQPVIDVAEQQGMRLAFEPEPGMFIATFADFAELLEYIDAPSLGLTIDIGHVQCVENGAIADHLRQWSSRLFNVHIEDMLRGVHEHLRFGDGEIDFPPVMAALREIGYTGGVHVELSRHGHMAPQVLRESFTFLENILAALPEQTAHS